MTEGSASKVRVRHDRAPTVQAILAELLDEETDPFGAPLDASEAPTDEHYFGDTMRPEDQHRISTTVVRVRGRQKKDSGKSSQG
jgi:hypothetical protein